jgi:hypothetical protein
MKKLVLTLAVLAVLSLPTRALAHAISIGYVNAGPGAATIWLGTYAHGVGTLEGSMNLVGVLGNPYPSSTQPFNLLSCDGVGCKPAGLIDGVTNFYADWDASIPNNLPLVNSETPFNLGCPSCGPVQHWQGVTFSGLTPGSYQFTWVPAPSPSQEWSPLSTQMNGVFDLTGVVNPVPDASSSLQLFGFALAGIGGAGRRWLRK